MKILISLSNKNCGCLVGMEHSCSRKDCPRKQTPAAQPGESVSAATTRVNGWNNFIGLRSRS